MIRFHISTKYKRLIEFILPGFLVGLYSAVFYLSNNITLLTKESSITLGLCLLLPPIFLEVIACIVYVNTGKEKLVTVIPVAIALGYLLLVLRPAITGLITISVMLSKLSASGGYIAYVACITFAATLFACLFRKEPQKINAILAAMIVAALVMNTKTIASALTKTTDYQWSKPEKYSDIHLDRTPNIYFIIPDSYGSPIYLDHLQIDIEDFKRFLITKNFNYYEDFFSSYQPTVNSLPAMLNMEHHYYAISSTRNASEVKQSAREISSGKNNFFRVLKNNGYRTQNIHQGTYLLLQGNKVDFCYPYTTPYVGAKKVLSQILGYNLLTEVDEDWDTWNSYGIEMIHKTVMEQLIATSGAPTVSYIHLWIPGHSSNKTSGHCIEKNAAQYYSQNIKKTNLILTDFLTDIILKDPEAVIILAGDHGPFISNKCSRYGVVSNLTELRDRAGIFLAVRWPAKYTGKYDNKLKTSVNLLRYILASLTKDDAKILQTSVPDEVYVRMENFHPRHKYFKVMDNGGILSPTQSLALH